MTKETVKPRLRRGKAAYDGATVELTGERISAILSDPKAPRRVKGKLEELSYQLYAETNAFSEPTPDSCAADFINGAISLSVTPDADAQAIYDEIVRLADASEPKEYKLARRCTEIYNAAKGNGAHYFAEHVDAVLEGGEDGLIPNPDSRYFTPLFIDAMRARGTRDRRVRALLDLIRRVDEGADLNELRDKAEAEAEEKRRRTKLTAPEPKDKTSDEWRYWKIFRMEEALRKGDVEAWGEFWSYFDGFKDVLLSREGYTAADASAARQMLPDLLIFWQKAQPKSKGKKK
jgi:hypothetical protein